MSGADLFFEEERTVDVKLVPVLQGETFCEVCLAELGSTGSTQAYLPKGVQAVGAPRMWSQNITGKGVLIGIIDTGVASHPDLVGKVALSRVYTGERTAPQNPHATHVAGTIAANGAIRGIAYEARLADYRVLSNTGSGSMDNVVKAVYDAVRDGCQVINMSLGGPVDYPPLAAAIRYAFNFSVPVIVAAGNEGDNKVTTNEFSYPAMYPTTQSVGAADYNGVATLPAYFTDSNLEVDCACQGINVISTAPNNNYMYMSGTSMATPHVTGVTALLIQRHLLNKSPYSTLSLYNEIKALCKDIYLKGRDNATGYGFVTFNPTLN